MTTKQQSIADLVTSALSRGHPDLCERAISAVIRELGVALVSADSDKLKRALDEVGPAMNVAEAVDISFVSPAGNLAIRLRALLQVAGFVLEAVPSLSEIAEAGASKYSWPVLQATEDAGHVRASDLALAVRISRPQLTRTCARLIRTDLLSAARYGRNVWYSVTPKGLAFVARYLEPRWISHLPKLLVAVLTALEDGYASTAAVVSRVEEEVGLTRELAKRATVYVLYSLQNAGLAHMRGDGEEAHWTIGPRVPVQLSRPRRSPSPTLHHELIERFETRDRIRDVVRGYAVEDLEVEDLGIS